MGTPDAGDFTRKLHQTLDELATLRAQLDNARTALAKPSIGEDSSKSVRLMLDADGRPARLAIVPGWRGDVGALAEAVREALQAATLGRIEMWAKACSDTPATPAPSSEPPAFEFKADAADLAAIGPLLREGRVALAEMDARASAGPPSGTGRDAGCHVAATVSGADLTGLRIDPGWMAGTSTAALAQALQEALAAAFAELARAQARAVETAPAIRAARELAAKIIGADPGGRS